MFKRVELEFKLILFARSAKNTFLRLKMNDAQRKLSSIKKEQKKSFELLRDDFKNLYETIKPADISSYVTPLWKEFNAKIEKVFLPSPPFSFLNDPVIMLTMFGGDRLHKEIPYLQKKLSRSILKNVLQEDYVGDPLIVNKQYLTSFNSIRQLYFLQLFLDTTNTNIKDIRSVVEWGGGYGNFAKLYTKLCGFSGTYVLIDTPLFACLQWLYLSVVFGKNKVHIITSKDDKIYDNKFNIIPLSFLKYYKLKCDLFVSMWGLSESSKYSQDFVFKNNWFHAKHLLLGYQQKSRNLPNAERLGEYAKKKGARIEKIDFLTADYYATL